MPKHEIIFSKENIDFNPRPCFLAKNPHVFAFSEASATGCGAVISLDSKHVCHKFRIPARPLKVRGNLL